MKNYLSTVFNIVEKDVLLELKSKEVVVSMLLFSLLVVIVFSFIFEPGAAYKDNLVGGILWMAIIFSGVLGLNKSMLNEITGGNLNALLLAPVDRSAVFFGKVFSNFFFLIIMEIITVPIFMVFYNINIFANSLMSIVVLALGTYGFAVLGTLFSLISVKTKTREIMLPLLLLPLMIPIILAGIQCMNIYILGEDVTESYKWLKLIGAFDVIFTAVIYAIFDYIVEE
ncbi:cytochrome c-type biogenesis protein CcmB [Flexistipes sinusarabici DSM 4947]|uniref:Heme exporter protein B n=2 Tax=Flexistipes sinusarabici TaxID=2352 RepID=F8E5U1_FLESM|nr:heme exporter protein CcmB [Flexistipes sinusarabici]AEI15782.1 cytochrome c-type biogenesis protein CcmB [Flexistipes sinusarabici DSM 4947]HCW93127.1 cytochrome C biogenesis protein [Flexistipes sinusarabici]